MKHSFKVIALCAALSSLLVACGGADEPNTTTRDGLITVSAATDATLNGIYSSANVGLSDVQTIVRAGATDACEFTYDALRKTTDSTVSINGRIRYLKDAATLNEYSININSASFAQADGVNTTVDRAGNAIRFNGAVVTAASGTGTITLTGYVPLQFSRPSGC